MMDCSSLSNRVIGAALEVHRLLGPGFIESIYENALGFELDRLGVPYRRRKSVRVSYKGVFVGSHRIDLVVDASLVVELKAIHEIETVHYGILRSYLRAMNAQEGLILNFGTAPLDIRRVAAT